MLSGVRVDRQRIIYLDCGYMAGEAERRFAAMRYIVITLVLAILLGSGLAHGQVAYTQKWRNGVSS